jgi:hypothetical protein
MINPIPKTGFVHTPDNIQELLDYCERFNGSERALAMLISTMTMNLCAKLVDDQEKLSA